jgi:hypothetical protein
MSTTQNPLRDALEQFRRSGDTGELERVLSDNKEEGNLLVFLQHALQTADDADLRDMMDDAAWALTNRQPLPRRPSEEELDRVENGAAQAYGPLITELLPDLRELVSGMITGTQTAPPPNAVIAALGLYVEQEAEVLRVAQDSFGQEARFFRGNCETCGGTNGSRGYLLCPACSRLARRGLGEKLLEEKVRADINNLPAAERFRVDVEATVANYLRNVDECVNLDDMPLGMVAEFMKENPGRYGCTECGNQPVRDCRCAQLVPIPNQCTDGWIAKGTRPASGESFYAVLRVQP